MILYEPVVFSESKTLIQESFKMIDSYDPVLLSERKVHSVTSCPNGSIWMSLFVVNQTHNQLCLNDSQMN